jgi:hypothetical protein
MKKVLVFMGILAIFFLTISDNAFCKSSENKAECERWCNANKPRCVKCDSGMSCGGRDLDIIKSFKKGTGNWYACGLSEYARETLKNKNECLSYCRQHKQDEGCEFCKETAGCGAGYTSIKTFGGRGKNWYACRLTAFRRESAKNRSECDSFCDSNPECFACDTSPACNYGGYNGEILKSFKGYGDNWYACRLTVRGLLTKEREEECEKMCKASDICDYCSPNRCLGSAKTVARFRGKGDTVYACKR